MNAFAVLLGSGAFCVFCRGQYRTRSMVGAIVGIVLSLGEAKNLQNRSPIHRIALFGLLAVLSSHFYTEDLSAKPLPPQEKIDAQKKNEEEHQAAAAEVVTIPDGTLLFLKLRNDFTSATVKVGDSLEFTTPYPARINGTIIVPADTAVSGTVSRILPPRRASRDSRVYVAIGEILLPNGQTATLRAQKSKIDDSKNSGKEVGNHPGMWTDTSVNQGKFSRIWS